MINKYLRNPADIKLCITHPKLPLYEDYLINITVLITAIIKIIYNKLIKESDRLTIPSCP